MGHVAGAGAGIAWLQLAANLAVSIVRRPDRSDHLAVLGALRGPATAAEASSERRTVERVLAVVRAQRAAEESRPGSAGPPVTPPGGGSFTPT
jgi:hypothetical protein